MRTLAVLLLLAAAVPATAEQPVITDFSSDGALVWTNSQTNVHCGIEWTMDLNWMWLPMDTGTWDFVTTSNITTHTLDPSLPWLPDFSFIPEFDRRKDSHFFRIVCASNSLSGPVFSNSVRVVNHSPSAMSNVVFRRRQGFSSTVITNVPSVAPAGATPYIPFEDQVNMDGFIAVPAVIGDEGYGWEVEWDLNGTNDNVAMSIISIGPHEKRITVTVSNSTRWVNWEWMGIEGVYPW